MDRWMITKESRELTVDFSTFSSIDVVHRPRTPPSMQPDPILNSFHSVSTFRHNFIIKRFAILRDRLSSKRRRIETVWQIIEERGRGEKEERRRKREISPEVSIIVVMEPAGSRMYRTYRSFPLGRQWMSPYLNHCWVKLVNYYLTSGVKLPDAICRYSTVFYGRNLGRETRHKWGGRVIRVSGNCTHFLCRKPPRKSFPRRRNKLKSLGLNRSSDRLIETSLQRKKERKKFRIEFQLSH